MRPSSLTSVLNVCSYHYLRGFERTRPAEMVPEAYPRGRGEVKRRRGRGLLPRISDDAEEHDVAVGLVDDREQERAVGLHLEGSRHDSGTT